MPESTVNRAARVAALLGIALAGAGCGEAREDGGREGGRAAPEGAESQARIERILDRAQEQVAAHAEAMDDALQPVPLLTGAEEGSLRRYLNAAQLARARRLGISPPADSAEIARLRESGRLVELEESTSLWIVRELDHSEPLVTPDTRALLTEIGERFQARLDSLGLPPLRLEVTSALRTAESQADLRQVNPNAARGRSTHEYGTTLDIAYSSFAAPEEPVVPIEADEVPWLKRHLLQMQAAVTETIAARRSRELQAVLGRVLREMQSEGKVMVTMERRQPVYHLTVARRY